MVRLGLPREQWVLRTMPFRTIEGEPTGLYSPIDGMWIGKERLRVESQGAGPQP